MGTPHKDSPRASAKPQATNESEADMEQPPNRTRENTLVIALFVLGGGIGLLYLDFITFGIVGSVLSLAAAIAVVGAMHYLLWGHALTKEVAAEREALLRQEENGAPPLTQAPADAIQ